MFPVLKSTIKSNKYPHIFYQHVQSDLQAQLMDVVTEGKKREKGRFN